MTDETFISEKTKKKYKVCKNYSVGGYICIQEIIEPKLEVGDWWLVKNDGIWEFMSGNTTEEVLKRASQIRKASGEVWKRINNEWVKQ